MLASCPPSTRCPVFRAAVGEPAVVQLRLVTSPSDHLLPALSRSRPLVLITACFSRFSPHLSHLNKTESISEALSCDRAEDSRTNLRTAAAGRCDQTPPKSQL